jgi:hypothetical protein
MFGVKTVRSLRYRQLDQGGSPPVTWSEGVTTLVTPSMTKPLWPEAQEKPRSGTGRT